MKHFVLLLALMLSIGAVQAQDAHEATRLLEGPETSTPTEPAMNPPVEDGALVFESETGHVRLWLGGTGTLVVPGTFVGYAGVVPVSGAGIRLMWIPERAAFRAGRVQGDQWNAENVGIYSTAMGFNTMASGEYSTAMGEWTTANGNFSTAMGRNTTAFGDYTTAMGRNAAASGDYSTAMGFSTMASGDYSTAMGEWTTAQAYASLVIGRWNVIQGISGSWVPGDPLFVVGNGTSSIRSNALTLLKDGNLTIAGTLTQNSDARLKEDVVTLESGLEVVLGLRAVRYRFIEGTNRPEGEHVGFIAQEVQEVLPELVQEGADGYLSVAYQNLAPVLAAAVQEQQAQIEAQQSEIESLRAENETMQSRLAEIETEHASLESRLASLERNAHMTASLD